MPKREFKIADILPNPFRHIEHYPIREDKVAAQMEHVVAAMVGKRLMYRDLVA